MSYSFSPPKLITTGLATRFTKVRHYKIDLKGESLADYFHEWKELSPHQVEDLYFGRVYRLPTNESGQLLLQVRKRSGGAFHFIDCSYELDTMIAKIKTPNTAALIYILFPGILGVLLGLLSKFNIYTDFVAVLGCFIVGCLIGSFFLNSSANSVVRDFDRAVKNAIDQKEEVI